MSLDQRQTTDYQPGPPRPGRGRVVLLVLGVLVAVLTVAGVVYMATRDDPPEQLDLTVPSTAPSAPAPASLSAAEAEKQAILVQYQRFFQVGDSLDQVPAAERPALFAQVAVDPSYSRTLSGVAETELRGEVGYGEIVTSPEIVSVADGTAIIRDCQDSTGSGLQKTDGTKVTRGVKDDLVTVTMLRGADGVWRVSRADYDQTGGCR
jgi:hypothetical protein